MSQALYALMMACAAILLMIADSFGLFNNDL